MIKPHNFKQRLVPRQFGCKPFLIAELFLQFISNITLKKDIEYSLLNI